MCWDKRDRWPLLLNKLKLMAHTSRVLQNRVQRLVIWDVSKYQNHKFCRWCHFTEGEQLYTWFEGAVTSFFGWLVFPWKRRQGIIGQQQDGRVAAPPNPCTQANDRALLCLSTTADHMFPYPNYCFHIPTLGHGLKLCIGCVIQQWLVGVQSAYLG